MKKLILKTIVIFLLLAMFTIPAFATIFYLDYENGDDANDGSDWAHAWKTITSGATAARIAPGDTIRIAKSPAPASIGNGTWTSKSTTVTLATAQNKTIDNCETAWTAAGDCTVTRLTSGQKQGSYCMKLAIDSTPQTSTLQAYYATGELDLSSYQKITFWIKNNKAIVAGNWVVNLCSDVAGETVVDSFLVTAIPSVNNWVPLTLTKSGGGNLGASIKSIAIYSGTDITGMASKYIYVDNFSACTTAGLSLQSLISKNSAERGGTEAWYLLKSINDETLLIDSHVNQAVGSRGYYTTGTSPETVTTYKRETTKTDMVAAITTAVQTIQDAGTSGNLITFEGGYDTGTSEQTGETFFDAVNGCGYGLYNTGRSYVKITSINLVRYYHGIRSTADCPGTSIEDLQISGCYIGIATAGAYCTLKNLVIHNNSSTGLTLSGTNSCSGNRIETVNSSNNWITGISVITGSGNRFYDIEACNNGSGDGMDFKSFCYSQFISGGIFKDNNGYGIEVVPDAINAHHVFNNIVTSGNLTAGIRIGSLCYLNKITTSEGTGILNNLQDDISIDERYYVTNHNGDSYIGTIHGTLTSESTDRVGGSGIMWKLGITDTERRLVSPLILPIAKIAVVANKLVTVNAYMKKSHATNIGAKLVCPGGQLAGITSDDVTDTKADDVDTWEELEISFTPTEAGVVQIEAWAYYIAGTGNVYVEDMTIIQAE